MNDLTGNQIVFCNEYLKDLNGTRAYKVAYTNVTKDETAAAASSRLLRNVKVKSYIDAKMKEIESEQIADVTEVLRYLTRVIRCEEYEANVEGVPCTPKISDRTKAAELLGKRYAMFTENVGIKGSIETNNPLKGLTTEDIKKLIK